MTGHIHLEISVIVVFIPPMLGSSSWRIEEHYMLIESLPSRVACNIQLYMGVYAIFFALLLLSVLVSPILCIGANPNPNSVATCSNTSFYESIPQLRNGGTIPSTRDEWISLLEDLYMLLKTSHVTVPYTSSDHTMDDPDVWFALGILDQDPNNATNVLSIYNYNESMPWQLHGKINGYDDNSLGWNREHVLCQSYGIQYPGADHSDLHNLRAVDWNVNSARSNLYYDDCYDETECITPAIACAEKDSTWCEPGQAGSDTAQIKRSVGPDSNLKNVAWRPPEVVKGDLAREAMYMALRYNGSYGEDLDCDSKQILLSECPCIKSHKFGNLTTLMRWAIEDPPSPEERSRNNLTCVYFQNNTNPFIEFPWLIQAFRQSPPLPMIHGACSDGYNGDPENCDLDFEDEVSAICNHPSAVPTKQPTFQPTNKDIVDIPVGSVVIIGYDQQDNSFEVVTLIDLQVNTVLKFTDNRYSNITGLGTTEGIVEIQVLQTIPAGTTWVVNADSMTVTKNRTHYPSLGNLTKVSGSFNLATSGDNVFIFAGDVDQPDFIFAFASKQWVDDPDMVNSNYNMLPSSLVNASMEFVSITGNFKQVNSTKLSEKNTASGFLGELTNEDNWMMATSSFTASDDDLVVLEASTYMPTISPTADHGDDNNDDSISAMSVYGVNIPIEMIVGLCSVVLVIFVLGLLAYYHRKAIGTSLKSVFQRHYTQKESEVLCSNGRSNVFSNDNDSNKATRMHIAPSANRYTRPIDDSRQAEMYNISGSGFVSRNNDPQQANLMQISLAPDRFARSVENPMTYSNSRCGFVSSSNDSSESTRIQTPSNAYTSARSVDSDRRPEKVHGTGTHSGFIKDSQAPSKYTRMQTPSNAYTSVRSVDSDRRPEKVHGTGTHSGFIKDFQAPSKSTRMQISRTNKRPAKRVDNLEQLPPSRESDFL